jgi:hypothetical protein
MRTTLLVSLLMTSIFLGTADAQQGTSRCAVMEDHDDRMTCFAVVTHNSSYCHFIKDNSKRSWCHVLVGK